MNLNKLLPRLTIEAKLRIAFAILIVLPLGAVGAIATPLAVSEMHRRAEETLQADLELMQVRTGGALREAEQHLAFVVRAFVGAAFADPDAASAARRDALASTFLQVDTTAVLRVRAIDRDGSVRLVAGRYEDPAVDRDGAQEGLGYLWAVDTLLAGERLVMPVELLDPATPSGTLRLVPAIALAEAVRDSAGNLLGVAVAEASAAALFSALDLPPEYEGVRGLVDGDGRLLYHSELKRDWSSLLPRRGEVSLYTEFEPEVASRMLSSGSGTIPTGDGRLVSYRPIARLDAGRTPLVLYSTAPLAVIHGPVRRFLLAAGGLGLGILVLGLAAGRLAAQQFTRPLYALQRAAHALAERGEVSELRIETNDEIEDLARDFSAMANRLTAHRRELETTVAARTRALAVTQGELERIVTHAADAIIGLDAQGRVRFWNRGAESLFGYDEAAALGEGVEGLIGGSEGDGFGGRDYIQRTLAGGGAVVNLRATCRTKDGGSVAVSLTATPVADERGRVVGASLIVRDDRLQRTLEEQMRRSERLAAVSIMAAGLAHEINNPLAILANRIELMQRDLTRGAAAPESLAGDLGVLGQHVGRLRELTTDLLRFARDETAPADRIDVGEVAQRAVRLLLRLFQSHGVTLALDRDEYLPTVVANGPGIETVLVNLLMNALQATPSGGTVRIRVGRSGTQSDVLRVEVDDAGTGVAPELRERIFEPFYSTKDGRSGTGLGLTVCRSVIERHGGRIWVEDGEKGGARFVVELPRGARDT